MVIKGLVDEDYSNYKKCSMFIIFPYCSLKCDKENQTDLCQNSSLLKEPDILISAHAICARYMANPLSKALVIGGLEPFDSPKFLIDLIITFRVGFKCNDDIVIYTGYTEEELKNDHNYQILMSYTPLIIKFGRYRPNEEPHYDEVLGIQLANKEQYAKVIGVDNYVKNPKKC